MEFQDALIALLHWKDGNAISYVRGEIHAKPNTINPILNLRESALAELQDSYLQFYHASSTSYNQLGKKLEKLLRKMWDSVVIPAFVLHLARPDKNAIIDQHTFRAYRAITEGNIDIIPKINWADLQDYNNFLDTAVKSSFSNEILEHRMSVDQALMAWGKALKQSKLQKKKSPKREVQYREKNYDKNHSRAHFWGQEVPNSGIVPPACNVVKALSEYIVNPIISDFPQWKSQNIRNLMFDQIEKEHLVQIASQEGGAVTASALEYYKVDCGGEKDIRNLPRPILDVYLVGWARNMGARRPKDIAEYLFSNGYGGTINAATAIVSVGKSTGLLFGLLDDTMIPTKLFKSYFEE